MAQIMVGLFGPMGSGKTYEAMEFHFQPAIKARQVVATNIKGVFEPQQMSEISRQCGVPLDELKTLLVELPSTREDLFKPGVWPNPLDWTQPSLVPPGAKVILDETSTLFIQQPPDFFVRYMTEQRHGVDARGNCGSMVIISQSTKVHHSVRYLLSAAYVFSQFTMLAPAMRVLRPLKLGFDYRAEVYTDMSKTIGKAKPDNFIARRYNLDVFKCYKSFDAEAFKDLKPSLRTTILGNWYIVAFIPLMLALAVYAGNSLIKRFGGAFDDANKVAISDSKPAALTSSSSVSTSSTQPISSSSSVPVDDLFKESSVYRLVGTASNGYQTLYYIDTPHGVRVLYPTDFKSVTQRGSSITITLNNGDVVSNFSGRRYISSSSTNSSGGSNEKQTASSSARPSA